VDHIIREWDMTKKENMMILQIEGHEKDIMQVIELKTPFAIASCSLDCTIKLYSLVDREEIITLKEHPRGVRCLTYNEHFGGNIVSCGFEHNLYVWTPEVTTNKSLMGKLEGHSDIVASCSFLGNKPYVVSIDEGCNLRVWDVRSFFCVQVIVNESKSIYPIYGIYQFDQGERFAILSKRFIFYDTKKKDFLESVERLKIEDCIPI
jgi:WD40 repeat protein